MAKISPVSIKYMIYADFQAEGTLDKPDVIGAIFGQSEGLLGEDLELRDLQKEGKIGRIEVNLNSQNGKTIGKIEIPSALDKTETTLIAAAIETIERIGPTNASIKVEKVEDVRQNKRDYILERAKTLLNTMDRNSLQSREIKEQVITDKRTSKIQEYGDEKLPSGDISGNEIIVTEGRADVLNLLKNGVSNVIGMNGTNLPKEIAILGKEKSITLLVDGDRGGILIARNAIDNAKIDFIAFAPDGKEVEQLTDKEILQALRKKISAEEFSSNNKRNNFRRSYNNGVTSSSEVIKEEIKEEPFEKRDLSKEIEEKKEELKDILEKTVKSKNIILLDYNLEILAKANSRNLYLALRKYERKTAAIVLNRASPIIIETAERARINTIIAKTFSGTGNINLVSL
jgi:DNA primase